MKPIYIEMQAFGSYQQEQIDFTGVDHGLFLITGSTGAGKTTIFDAITFALYGKTSGGKRDGRMMRSQYAPEDLRTQVRMKFCYAGKEYTITRIPEQPNWKKEKETGKYKLLKGSIKPSVELIMPDGSVYPGKIREIDQKIEEIIGLNAEQFTQIAMLAQGDFMKLLLATSEERKEIFSRIFDTGIYAAVEGKIKLRFDEAAKERLANREEIVREFGRIQCLEESIYKELWDAPQYQEHFSESDSEGLMELAEKICLEAEEHCRRLQELREEKEQQITAVNRQLQLANTVNTLFINLAKEKARMEELEKQKEQMKSWSIQAERAIKANNVLPSYLEYVQKGKDTAESRQRLSRIQSWILENRDLLEEKKRLAGKAEECCTREKPRLLAEIQRIQDGMEELQKAAMYQKERDQAEKEIRKLEKELQSVQEGRSQCQEQLEQTDRELENRKRQQLHPEVLQLKLEACLRREKDLEEIREQLLVLDGRTENGKAQEQQPESFLKQPESSLQHSESSLQQQAELLRRELKEGRPCPVCGRIHYSMEALEKDLKENREQKRELDRLYRESCALQKQMEEADKQKKGLQDRMQQLSGRAEQVQRRLYEQRIAKSSSETSLNMLASRLLYADRSQAQAALIRARSRAEELEDQQKKSTAQYNQLKAEMDSRQSLQIQERSRSGRLQQELQEAEAAFRFQLEKEGFSDAEDFLKARRKADALEEVQKRLNEYQVQCQVTREAIGRLEAETEGKEVIDTAGYEEEMKTLEAEKKKLEQQDRSAHMTAGVNRMALEKGRWLYAVRSKLNQKYMVLNNLNNTANGKMENKHMKFQTYVQRRFFRQIIDSANRRLYQMSAGQFLLQCRELDALKAQGQVGLDLDVYSLVNEQTRDVKTLSGGESFMAALSMALGMADMIQNSHGSVHIDTMFIDEGFGSLSEETRNQAISILNELSGGRRLVGIISHVTELKSQVETRLQVSRNSRGSQARWEL